MGVTCSHFDDPAVEVVTSAVRAHVFDMTPGEGMREMSELDVLLVSTNVGTRPGQAILRLRLENHYRSGSAEDRRMEDVFNADGTIFDEYLEHDIAVFIRKPGSEEEDDVSYWQLWAGTITGVVPNFSDNSEGVQLIAQDFRWKMGCKRLYGQWANIASTPKLTYTDVVMNPLGEGNYGGITAVMAVCFGKSEERTAANVWTLARAINYIVDNYRYLDYEDPEAGTVSRFIFPYCSGSEFVASADDIELPTVNLKGRTPAEALSIICGHAGHTWWLEPAYLPIAVIDHQFEARPVLRVEDIQKNEPFPVRLPAAATENADRKTTWPQAGNANFDLSGSVNEIHILGQHYEYEAMWVLAKNWNGTDEASVTANSKLGQRDHSSHSTTLDPVHRQWILDEDGGRGGTGTSQCTVVFVTGGGGGPLRAAQAAA